MDDLRPAGPAEYRWLLAVQERERRLLAQAVHDDIGQYLTGIRTQLLLLRCTAGDGQPALARLERYCQGLDDSFRALLRGLPPPALQRQSLDEALRACVADWQEGQGIACELRLGGPLPPLEAAAGTHLYRPVAGGAEQRRPACRRQPRADPPATPWRLSLPERTRRRSRLRGGPGTRLRPGLDAPARALPGR
ncbi:sensor kinase [Pseudomonas aeruginosa]|nr:sensor kinase [Pseudomonas aeruginosa]